MRWMKEASDFFDAKVILTEMVSGVGYGVSAIDLGTEGREDAVTYLTEALLLGRCERPAAF